MQLRQIIPTVATVLLISNNVTAAPNPTRMFGAAAPFTLSQLPVSPLKSRLEGLSVPAQIRAMNWLHTFTFPDRDLEHLKVDFNGAVFYEETELPEEISQVELEQTPTLAGINPTNVFELHSRPGSNKVVYLDFTGHLITGTGWNQNGDGTTTDYDALPFDTDGDDSTFSESERLAIAEVWHRVAEDLAAFDIDVTTEEPDSFGPEIGRILITKNKDSSGDNMPSSSSGGVAYVGVWGASYYPTYQPALVYYNNLASYPPYIAEASSHEFGHNLGLSHDGTVAHDTVAAQSYYTGHGDGYVSWGPIMGVGYYTNVTQWSNGDYTYANNTQDDLAIISGLLDYRSDDHGDSLDNSTPLLIDGNGEIASSNPEFDPLNQRPENKGVIETSTDIDVFYFDTDTGTINLTIEPAWAAFTRNSLRGANLDIEVKIYTESGSEILIDPLNDTNASITTELDAGRYFLEITGVGNTESAYSDYGSLGQYYISGSIIPVAEINDIDEDGITDEIDNCPTVSNSSQSDVNDNNIGDACDISDTDDDGLTDEEEIQLGTDPNNSDSDNDGTPDGQDSDPLDSSYQGSANGAISVNGNWTTVSLPTLFDNPVVIAGPPSFHGIDPGVVRIKNVSSTISEAAFDIRFQEWDYKNGGHAAEIIPYIVMEAGRHVMADGSVWEVGAYTQEGTGTLQTQSFDLAFDGTPELFLTAQSNNGDYAVTVRAKNVTSNSFDSGLYLQESLMGEFASEETIGYLAIYSPSGSGFANIAGQNIPYIVRQEQVDERWVSVLSSTIKMEEEKSKNNETNHSKETLSVLGLGQHLFAQDISLKGADTIALRQILNENTALVEWGTIDGVSSDWSTIPLGKSYTNPIVVAKLGVVDGQEPAVIRIQNVKNDSFQVNTQEWSYLDGIHSGERIHYMVAEQGSTSIGGLTLQAGKLNINSMVRDNTPDNVDFNSNFVQSPAVFAGVMSYQDTETVITRVDLIDTNGFNVSLQEQESNSGAHSTETIGWIAIEQGVGQTEDGRKIEVSQILANGKAIELQFNNTLNRYNAVSIGSLSSVIGVDPATAQQTAISNGAVSFKVNEEVSKDIELSHVKESISVFIAE